MALRSFRTLVPRRLAAPLLAALLAACGSDDPADAEIPMPEIVHSRDGVLRISLEQAPAVVTVAGTTFTSNVFNGRYIPPVLMMNRGDRLELELVNRIGKADVQIAAPMETNLHYHGMVVPPAAPGDDVFLHVGAGADYTYRWQVPADHSQGLHWYHPHAHGLVEPQILSGMSGLLVIDGQLQAHYPAFVGLAERWLLLKDIVLPGAADGSPNTKTINGVLGGTLRMQPGEMQVWNIGNVGADAYFDFAVAGAQLWEINRDGNVLIQPRPLQSVYLPPGSRSIVLVVAPSVAGSYAVRSLAVDTGPQGDPNPDVPLARLVVSGAPQDTRALQAQLLQPAQSQDTIVPTPAQVAALPITRKRTIVFSETADGNTFFLNGREYDPDRDDVTVNLGDVEEWTLRNVSGERHVFHIHQLDFLVTSVNGQAVAETNLRDVIDLPYQQDGVPGEVVVTIPFTDPVMVGRFVFHCHIVGHEDAGMMANLVVLPAGQTAAMAPARMRTVQPARSGDALSRLLARWTGRKAAPDPSFWPDAVCRAGDTAVTASRSARNGISTSGAALAIR